MTHVFLSDKTPSIRFNRQTSRAALSQTSVAPRDSQGFAGARSLIEGEPKRRRSRFELPRDMEKRVTMTRVREITVRDHGAREGEDTRCLDEPKGLQILFGADRSNERDFP